MDWVFAVFGSLYFFGLVLSTTKLFYTFQEKAKGYTNLCIQYCTGSCILAFLLATLGILAARLSKASIKTGVDIFLFTVAVYVVTAVSFSFMSMILEMGTSLSRKFNTKILLQLCIAFIVFSPLCTSGLIGGFSAKEGALIGIYVIPMTVMTMVIMSAMFIALFFRKAKLLEIAISPIFQDSLGGNISRLENDTAVLAGPTTIQDMESPPQENVVKESLKSSLKRKEDTLKDVAQRSVCFLIGKETEIWRKEKEIRRIEKERDKALIFIVLLLCYSICFLPLCCILLYYGEFSLELLGCKIAYSISASFAVVEPIVYIVYMNCKKLAM